MKVRFKHGDEIVTMGEASPGIFFIIEGTCDMSLPALDSDGMDIAGELSPGEFFGDLSIVHGSAASANIIASTDIVVCHVRVMPCVPYHNCSKSWPSHCVARVLISLGRSSTVKISR